MAKKKTLEELRLQQEKLEQDLKLKNQNLKVLKQKTAELERRNRTHRLCVHGAMLEQYLKPDEFTDDQIKYVLMSLFRTPETEELLNSVKQQTEM